MTLDAERIDPPIEDRRQQRAQMGAARGRDPHLRAARLGDDRDLPHGATAARALRRRGRNGAHDGRRHRGRQGRLPESRPDGLRQPLRHGLLLTARTTPPRPWCGSARRRANNVALAMAGKAFAALPPEQQAAATAAMQRALQGIDLTKHEVVLPDSVAGAIVTVRDELAKSLNVADPATGWTPAYSLNPQLARQTADFLVFSALTTVARRPGVTWSWTENWPYEPLVGNTPTTNTFRWTWISFCFTFFAFGVVLFIYEFFLNNPDDAPMDPVLATFRPLTPSQRRIGKYFLVVAALLLVQIAAGTIMAHSYYDRTSFYGIAINDYLAVQLPARRAYPGADRLDRPVLDRRGAVPRARDRRRPGSEGPALAGGFPVLGDAADRRRRADRRLSRHHGRDRPELVLVRQSGPLLHPARPLLADRLLRRARAVEPAGDARAMADRRALAEGGWPVLVGPHPAGAPDLGLHHQHRGPLRVRHDPAHRDREVLHAHRLLALVGGPSLGRAVLRVLRRRR